VARITGTLQEDQYTCMFISRSFLLRIRNVSDKIFRENQNTRFIFQRHFFSETRPVYEKMWKNMVQPDRPQMKTWRTLDVG